MFELKSWQRQLNGLLVVLGSCGSVIADPSPAAVVEQVLSSRSRLFAGDVAVRGRHKKVPYVENSREGRLGSISQAIDERIVFDQARGLLRYEVEKTKMTPESQASADQDPSHEIYVAGTDRFFVKYVEAKRIDIFPQQEFTKLIDVRTVGLCSYEDAAAYAPLSAFEAAFQRGLAEGHISVEATDIEHIIIMTLHLSHQTAASTTIPGRRRFWIDCNRGHTPIKMEQQMAFPNEGGDLVWRSPLATAATEWTERNGAWVPISTALEYFIREKEQILGCWKYELAFEWHSVNEDIASDVFGLGDLDIPPQSHFISDRRKPEGQRLLQHPAVPDARMVKKLEEAASKPERSASVPTPKPKRATPVFYIVALVNVVLLVAFVTWSFLYRRR
jgi:hypothetical protein